MTCEGGYIRCMHLVYHLLPFGIQNNLEFNIVQKYVCKILYYTLLISREEELRGTYVLARQAKSKCALYVERRA